MTPQTNQVLWLELGRYYFDTPKYHSNAMRFIGNGEQVTLLSVARILHLVHTRPLRLEGLPFG
jgi:hypothetical protein